MGYYNNKGHFFSDEETLEHRAKYGTANSTSSSRGKDGKKDNTPEYNHKYYEEHPEKWKDNKKKDNPNKRQHMSDDDDQFYNADGTARFGHKDYDENDADFKRTDGKKIEGTDLTVFKNANGSTIILGKGIKFSFPPGTKITSAMEKKLASIENGVKDKDKNKESYVAKMLNAVTGFADRQGLNTDTAGKKSDEKKSDKKKSEKKEDSSSSSSSSSSKKKEDDKWDQTVNKYSSGGGSTTKKSSDYNKPKTEISKSEAEKLNKAAQERGKKQTESTKKKKKNKTTKQNAQLKQYFGEDGAIISYYDRRY